MHENINTKKMKKDICTGIWNDFFIYDLFFYLNVQKKMYGND